MGRLWAEGYIPGLQVGRSDLQDAGFGGGCGDGLGTRPPAPLLAVQNKTRRIDRVASPCAGVGVLAFGKGFRRPWVAPAEIIPVVHVKGARNKIFPEGGRCFELCE